MANGPLRTFFRQDAGYPEMDEPDLTDALLDSMIQKRIGVGAPMSRTSAGRMGGAMSMMAGGGGIPENPQFNNANVPPQGGGANSYPPMPGAPPGARPMPQMPKQGWGDVLAQVLAGAGDVVSIGGGRPTNYLQQTMGMQKGMRNEAFQQAMAQRGAMEQAERLAHEYDWRRYGAGRAEEKQNFYEESKKKEADLYEKMLGKEKERGEQYRQLLAATLPAQFEQAEDLDSLKALSAKALMETKGDPALMAEVKRAEQVQLQKLILQNKRGPMEKWTMDQTGGEPFWGKRGWLRDAFEDRQPVPYAPQQQLRPRSMSEQFGEGMRYWHP